MSLGGFMDKAKDFAGEHPDQVDEAVGKGGDMVDERTGGKYSGQVDTAQEKATSFLGGGQGDAAAQGEAAQGEQPQP